MVVLRVWRGPMPGWWCVTRHPGTHVMASAARPQLVASAPRSTRTSVAWGPAPQPQPRDEELDGEDGGGVDGGELDDRVEVRQQIQAGREGEIKLNDEEKKHAKFELGVRKD